MKWKIKMHISNKEFFKWIGDNVKKLIFIYLQKYLDYVYSVQNL